MGFPTNDPYEPYDEILIEKLVLKFKHDGKYSREWQLTQEDLLDYGRISAQKVDIAAINLTEPLEKTPGYKEYLLNKSFFTAKNLCDRRFDYDMGTRVKVLGYRSEYDFSDKTYPFEYPGKIVPITENDLKLFNYRQFVFAVDAFCPRGVSGSPVILDGPYNTNYGVILLGSCSLYSLEYKKGIITYADMIRDIILDGIMVHREIAFILIHTDDNYRNSAYSYILNSLMQHAFFPTIKDHILPNIA
jgi:hypothetical protein